MLVSALILLVVGAFSAPVKEEILPPVLESDDSAETTTEKPEFELDAKSSDLVFLVDVTGSMGSYIRGVKEAINKIVENANKKEISLRLAFIGYRDPFGDGDVPEITPEIEEENFEILAPTSSIKEFKDFVSEVRADGGGDGPEDVFGGLEKAGEIEWNSEASKRVLFLIADAPPHGSEFGGFGSHEDGDPLKRDLANLLAPMKEADVELIFGRVNSDTEAMVDKLSEVWGSKLRTFPVAGNRDSWGPPPIGGPMPFPRDGPGWGPPMMAMGGEEMDFGGGFGGGGGRGFGGMGGPPAARMSFGPSGPGSGDGIAAKIAEAVDEVIV